MKDEKTILSELIKMLNLIKRCTFHNVEDFKPKELTLQQSMLIGFIAQNSEKDLFQRDIESAFNIRRSSVTNLIQQIEKKGFIKRETVESDARLKKIVLTEKSIKINKIVKEKLKEIEMQMTKNISKEELSILFNIIDKINKNMEETK